jgi:Mrp family chromosome partitioning ATPase/capsular polysaccharide biosynthesis protein
MAEQMTFDSAGSLPAPTSSPEQALGPYFRAVRRNWLLVAAITLLTGVVAAATVLRSTPTYQASAKVLVSPRAQSDPNFVDTGVVVETGEPVRTIQTAAALINSQPAAQTTAATMGRGWTATRVQEAISVTPLGQSDILEITAQASTAAQAATLANAFAQAAVGYRAMIVQHNISAQLSELNRRLNQVSGPGLTNVSLAQQLAARIDALRAAQIAGGDPTLTVTGIATPPGSPTGAPHWLIIFLSLVGGFAIGSVAALAVEFFNRRVRDLDEIEMLFPAPVLAAVPRVGGGGRRSGLRPEKFPPAAFEQFRMLRVQLSNRERAPVLMLTSPGASDGKTTLAAALAVSFAETGEDVILMDFDLRKPDIAQLFGLPPRRAVSLVDATLEELLVEVPGLPHVRVLPAPRGGVALFSMLLARLPDLLVEAKALAGHVVIDASPVGLASESLQLAKICDQVVVAVRPGHTERQRLILARDLLARAQAPVVGVVIVAQNAATATYGYGYGYSYAATDETPADEIATKGVARTARRRVRT